MPRAKRSQVVTLTKTKSNRREGHNKVIRAIEEAADNYDYVWVFSVANMRNQYLKEVRHNLKTSRFFLGKNKVMAKALGNDAESEIKQNIHKISEVLVGDVGLLFTNDDVETIKKHFDSVSAKDYPRAGNIATYRVVVPGGEVLRGYTKESFPNNMEPELRQLGMPTLLRAGKITIESDFVICEKGDRLTSQQSRLLKHFWEQMAEFKVKLLCYWHNNGDFVELESNPQATRKTENDSASIEESDEDME
ncbi:mRNA turnover and ribosome assembly protein [Coemansia interrupta]|uniref:Ribosome assembly factor mrt4 n=1 Tax=Coemansia interrupta TaxID=1126814 RepID=A0A9W8LPC5_9FUNG|nr:mRNA turnover and ribosome assembly protein [Coemansia interrupta]